MTFFFFFFGLQLFFRKVPPLFPNSGSAPAFTPHINQVISKATRMLNFAKRNLYRCSAETKCLAYTSIVRPLLEYGSAVWDPYLQKEIQSIEMVQRRAARWVKSDYLYNSSVK